MLMPFGTDHAAGYPGCSIAETKDSRVSCVFGSWRTAMQAPMISYDVMGGFKTGNNGISRSKLEQQ
jgi:hypothetical protein